MNIFISHSSKDSELVESFINLITNALRVDPNNVFCTSIDGHKIESGEDWRNAINNNLEKANLSFVIATNNYVESEICLCELGAIYFNSNTKLIPLSTSKSIAQNLGSLLKTKQFEYFLESASLERIKDIIIKEIGNNIKSDLWDRAKKKFLQDAQTLIELSSDTLINKSESEKLVRGFHSEYIVDSIFSYHDNTSNIELINQLSAELRNNNDRTIDLKYNYLGATSAANWITLSKHPGYGHSRLIRLINDNAEEIVNQINLDQDQKIDYVSLGSGDGEIDKYIILNLLNKNNLNIFYPFDISFELLQKVVNEVRSCNWWHQKLNIKAIHGDFSELVNYTKIFDYDNVPNFFSLLGFTFGNYNEGGFIGKLKEGMRKGDFLLLDARLHDMQLVGKLDREDKEKIISNYNNESTNRFVFGALETVTNADYKSVTFEYVPTQYYTDVPNAVNIMINCKGVNARFRSDNKPFKKDSICLGLTTLYSFDDLTNWLSRKGFIVVYKKQASGIGFILLKKN